MNKHATVIIPTYNATAHLSRCLESLMKQNIKKISYEIFIVDGGSTDTTKKIAKEYQKKLPITLLKNPEKDAESAKHIGIKNSHSPIVILLDADNEILSKDWLADGLTVFKKHPDVWGVETPWRVNPKDSLINQYFSLLKIADPVARCFAPKNSKLDHFQTYNLVTVKKNDTPIIGANGFFWRKSLMKDAINTTNKFEETNYVSHLVSLGHLQYAQLTRSGMYHYYCMSLKQYIKKREKIAKKFLKRKQLKQKTWFDKVGKVKFIFAIVYNISFIGPLYESVTQIVKTKNLAWIFHPIICFLTVAIYGLNVLRTRK